jgi:RHS repeat-associated protein
VRHDIPQTHVPDSTVYSRLTAGGAVQRIDELLTTTASDAAGRLTKQRSWRAGSQVLRTYRFDDLGRLNYVFDSLPASPSDTVCTPLYGPSGRELQSTTGEEPSAYRCPNLQDGGPHGSGTTVNRYEYGPMGEQPAASENVGNALTWKGREADWATGLYYVRARWYDPTVGRFVSEDPLGLAGGINPYVFTCSPGMTRWITQHRRT